MNKGTNTSRVAAIACALSLMVAGTTGWASPASADDPVGVMPDIKGATLQAAVDAFPPDANGLQVVVLQPMKRPPAKRAANVVYLRTTEKNTMLQVVYNLVNWEVCSQSPQSGAEYQASTYLHVNIARPGEC